ncbi:TraR/DksA family transcriptional regulator [Streptomyces prasinopilosus]|uniref:Transcriptional regulator, TraR/DksA family n=1 Tax=Streptomyces prasinopilosus TaxID=67344 RepID=A0A1G6V9H8_9ACTN|nr:TraR/DksA family transcriptional regulator [Streptomyces prasinopilosus]SDD49495.1 transcriptional regulator, TraR/DksA family [Streptomyces prasinopilosus]
MHDEHATGPPSRRPEDPPVARSPDGSAEPAAPAPRTDRPPRGERAERGAPCDGTSSGGAPPAGAPDDRRRLHDDLTARIETLRRRKDSAEAEIAALWADCALDAVDAGATRAAVAEARVRADETRGQLEQALAARRRLDDGTFGSCVSCGAPIDRERMLAVPHTELCVSCRRAHESRRAPARSAPPGR